MYAPISSRYLTEVSRSYNLKSVASVLRSGRNLFPDFPLAILEGEVTGNVNDPIRRTVRCVFSNEDGSLIPTLQQDPFMPNGTEFVVNSGPVYETGEEELLPVGRFRITDVKSDNFGRIEVQGFDLAITMQTGVRAPIEIPAGMEVGAAIGMIARKKNPAVQLRLGLTGQVTSHGVVDFADNPFQRMRQMAYAAGYDLFFDPDGFLTLAPLVTSTTSNTNVEFIEGDNAQFWNPTRQINSEQTPSVIVVEANHSSLTAPLRVAVEDTNPKSETYAAGPYGEVVHSIVTDKVNQVSQCQVIGLTALRNEAWAERFEFECLPNQALWEGDQIGVTRAAMKLNSEAAIVESFTLPLHPAAMTVSATSRRQPDLGSLAP